VNSKELIAAAKRAMNYDDIDDSVVDSLARCILATVAKIHRTNFCHRTEFWMTCEQRRRKMIREKR